LEPCQSLKKMRGGDEKGLIQSELEKFEQFEDEKTAIESVNPQIIKICIHETLDLNF